MKCELWDANLNVPESVLLTDKLSTRLNPKDEVVLPRPQRVSVTYLDEEVVECAECGEFILRARAAHR